MSNEEEQVAAALNRFYAALDELIGGKGTESMRNAWHHGPRVTSAHPMGDWARGWDEVWATWQVFAQLGGPEQCGSAIRDVRIEVGGDLAYTTCVFISAPAFGRIELNCTNVLRRVDGEWKMVHHHADKAPGLEAALTAKAAKGA